MTSTNRFIDRAARNAGKLPLARIVAALLGVATAFFCFAMPQRVLDATLGTLGVPVPVGSLGRTLFILFCAGLAAGLGWLVVTVADSAASAADIDNEIDLDPPQPRRRAIGPSDPSEALSAPMPALLAVRRGDGHPDAQPRRPIFADHDLPVLADDLSADDLAVAEAAVIVEDAEFQPIAEADVAASVLAVPGEDEAPAADAPAASADAEPADRAAIVAEDPLDLTEMLSMPGDVPPAADESASDDAIEAEPAPPTAAEPEPTDTPVAVEAPTAATADGEQVDQTEKLSLAAEASPPVADELAVVDAGSPPAGTDEAEPAVAVAVEPAAVEEQPLGDDEALPLAAEIPAPAAEAAPPEVEASPAGESSLADLMVRLETGLDRQAGDQPSPQSGTVTPLQDQTAAPDDALRNALEALQRLAARQR